MQLLPDEGVRCAIVVPCYNEFARLKVETFRHFIEQSPSLLFIFVNDGSRDNTLEVLGRIRQGVESRVLILDQPLNRGKAEAVRSGLLQALSLNVVCAGFWDADLATPLPAIYQLLEILETNPKVDLVFGSRVKLLGRQIKRDPRRHIAGRVFATVVSNLLRLPIYDTQCGAKLFRNTPELLAILQQPFRSTWVFDVEILARLIRLNQGNSAAVGERIYEYPLHEWEDIGGSKVQLKDFFAAILDVYRIHRTFLS